MDDCAPTLADGTTISLEGGTYRKKLVFIGSAGQTPFSSATFLMPRVASRDGTRCPALQLDAPAVIIVVHRTDLKKGSTLVSAVSVSDGKTVWTRKLPGAPDGIMPYWLSSTRYCRSSSGTKHEPICERTTEGVRLYNGVLYLPYFTPPQLIALDPATGKVLWTYR